VIDGTTADATKSEAEYQQHKGGSSQKPVVAGLTSHE
jgi:hypothetical protein